MEGISVMSVVDLLIVMAVEYGMDLFIHSGGGDVKLLCDTLSSMTMTGYVLVMSQLYGTDGLITFLFVAVALVVACSKTREEFRRRCGGNPDTAAILIGIISPKQLPRRLAPWIARCMGYSVGFLLFHDILVGGSGFCSNSPTEDNEGLLTILMELVSTFVASLAFSYIAPHKRAWTNYSVILTAALISVVMNSGSSVKSFNNPGLAIGLTMWCSPGAIYKPWFIVGRVFAPCVSRALMIHARRQIEDVRRSSRQEINDVRRFSRRPTGPYESDSDD